MKLRVEEGEEILTDCIWRPAEANDPRAVEIPDDVAARYFQAEEAYDTAVREIVALARAAQGRE